MRLAIASSVGHQRHSVDCTLTPSCVFAAGPSMGQMSTYLAHGMSATRPFSASLPDCRLPLSLSS